jgi:hypothetical protein
LYRLTQRSFQMDELKSVMMGEWKPKVVKSAWGAWS